ncbi:hypothetical protein NC652_030718 [Populus alba x Populus x berolinensis]|nr:hypothetical protein NC652_030718 [Populus alba x Populus x berolinensis]
MERLGMEIRWFDWEMEKKGKKMAGQMLSDIMIEKMKLLGRQ